MSFWDVIFGRKKSEGKQIHSNYATPLDFVNDNVLDVKTLLSSVGYNDRHKRLSDLANMCDCQTVLLCERLHGQDKYRVVESSDKGFFAADDYEFSWPHSQPRSFSRAYDKLETVFPKVGAQSCISVPIKNYKNIQSGLLLGLSVNEIDDLDSRTRLLHMMAPFFDAEIESERLKHGKAQYEQRIISLRQNIEVMTNDLNIEKAKSAENKELKSIFLTNLSHEIRTPMNVIMGFVDLLETAESDQDRSEFIAIIKQNCDTLLKVIDNLIEISKLQSTYMFKAATPVQLNDLLNDIKGKCTEKLQAMGKTSVSVETSYALTTPYDTIWNSEEIITKTLDQLIDNACKFTDEGKISFGYTIDHKEATFFVRDTGRGIKNGEEEKIFSMFSVVDNSLTRQTSGTGIGLALARKYVELSNGRVWCDTGYKGGACFYFTIPTDKL